MTDLLTKVKDALEEHESFWDSQGTWMGGETTPLEDLAPDMARALIAAEELANAAAPYAHNTEGLNHGLHVALAAFRAAMEGRTDG
jgi:hypothetical protein